MRVLLHAIVLCVSSVGLAGAAGKVVDIPTRPGVTQRFVLIETPEARASVVLLAGGHGGLQLDESGAMRFGRNNFLVRSAPLFAARELTVAIVDAPSDRQAPPFLDGFRETAEHADDLAAVIAWLRETTKRPVWLVGTSRGTQSAAAAAIRLGRSRGPDGLVLTTTIVSDTRARAVTAMPVETLTIPVLVVHHEQDGCRQTFFRDVPRLMDKLTGAPRKALLSFRGGENEGHACEGRAYHGFNGLEADVVSRISAWITER